MPIRAVLDTDVLMSGLVSADGPPRRILDAWLMDLYTLVTSLYLVEERIHVLSYPRITARLRLDETELTAILAGLLAKAEVTPGQLHLTGVTRDPKDDAVLACAVEGEADYIVSGDQDLLAIDQQEGIQVVPPRRFLEILGSTERGTQRARS